MPYSAYGRQQVSNAEFTVTVTHPAAGMTLVQLAGELDSETSLVLDRRLEQELRDPHRPALVLDLSHLSFCGVAGLTCLLQGRDLARDHNTQLRLVTGPLVERLLRILDLRDHFLTCPTLTAATSTGWGCAATPMPVSSDPALAAHAVRVS